MSFVLSTVVRTGLGGCATIRIRKFGSNMHHVDCYDVRVLTSVRCMCVGKYYRSARTSNGEWC